MLNRYAMTTVALPTKNSPSNQVVPSRQVNTAHALAQYLANKQNKSYKQSMTITKANRVTHCNTTRPLVQHVSYKKILHLVIILQIYNDFNQITYHYHVLYVLND